MQASVEPDGDHDGLGDETQDPCVSPNFLGCPPQDRIAPSTATSFEARQGFLKTGRIVVRERSNEAGAIAAEGLLEVHGAGGRSHRLRRAGASLERPGTVRLVLRVPKGALRAARKVAAKGKAVTAKVSVTASDDSGNEATSSVVVKPSPPRR